MESPPQSNLLPEVDSLPDGFVDGAAEPPPPLISPSAEEENRIATNNQTVDVSIEKAEKLRTFPVPLCEETDGNDDDDDVDDLIQVSSKLSLEQKEEASSPPPPVVCQTCKRCE